MTTVWQVTTAAIGRLDQASGIDLMERLLHGEARRIGITSSDVVITKSTNVADGGIDAKVTADAPASPTALIAGNTHYQLKSGTSFKPWQPAAIRAELFGKHEPHKDLLGEAVRSCLDNDETYCVVTLGHDLSPDQHSKAVRGISEVLSRIGYASPKVKVLGQGQLRAIINSHPAIPLSLLSTSGRGAKSIDMWKRDSQMAYTLQLGPKQTEFIGQVQKYARSEDIQHIRLTGEPGIGKTRLALTALDADDLKNSVVYFDSSTAFQSSDLFNAIVASPDDYEAIIVIDDCDERDRIDVWKSLKGQKSYKLITIDHSTRDISSEATRSLTCPLLPDDQIRAILSTYVGEHASLHRWAEWCSGSPRVAHAVGANLKANPEDLLKKPDDVDTWGRFIDGFSRQSDRDGRTVLRHLALFHKFGFEPPYAHEAEFISTLVLEADPTITWAKFQEIVQKYRERRVIQGDKTLLLVPRALQIYLWKDYWECHGRGINLEEILQRIPETMRGWFTQNLNLAHLSSVATSSVSLYLQDIANNNKSEGFVGTKFGAEILRILSETAPDESLRVIESFLDGKSDKWLKGWTNTQQQVVWALERLAVWESTFERAFDCLRRLAVTTAATNSNNAKGTISHLFRLGEGWAPTQVSAQDRLPYIAALLNSEDGKDRALGIHLCETWLNLYGGMRIIGAEHQGARPDIEFWRPATYGEIFELLLEAWRLLVAHFKKADDHEKSLVLTSAINICPQLLQIPSISSEVMEGISEICTHKDVDRDKAVSAVIGLMRRPGEKRSKEIKEAIRQLDKAVTGTSWEHQYERWCAYSRWDEDYIFRRDKAVKSNIPEKRLRNLAKRLIDEPTELSKRIRFATRIPAHRAFAFGRILSALDKKQSIYPELMRAIRSTQGGDSNILRGYVSGLPDANYDQIVYELLVDKNNTSIAGAVLASLDISDVNMELLVKLYREGHLGPGYLAGFRRFSRNSSEIVSNTLQALLDNGERDAIRTALVMVDQILEESPEYPLNWDQVAQLVNSEFALVDSSDNMTSFYWSRIAHKLIEHDSIYALPIFRRTVEIKDALSPYRGGESPAKVAHKIVSQNPKECWPIIAAALEASEHNFTDVFSWLTDREHNQTSREVMLALDFDDLVQWVEIDRPRRARILGQILPKTLDETPAGLLTQRALDCFGDDHGFTSALYGRFWSGSWSGPRSAHHERQREQARRWLSAASSPRVKTFLTGFINSLTKNIEHARSEEEREY